MDAYWSLPANTVVKQLYTSSRGLTTHNAQHRLKVYGPNQLRESKKYNLIWEIVKKLGNPLILILLFSSAISALLGEIPEFTIVLAILVISILIDTWQEHGAHQSALKLQAHVRITTTIKRDGKTIEIPLSQLVPGDIVILAAGDIVPADCRLIESNNLTVIQSVLTGESIPAEKDADVSLDPKTPLAERRNSIYMGTSIAAGTGIAVVVNTGKQTEYGKIAEDLAGKRPETEFQRGSRQFGTLISKLTFILVAIVFGINVVLHHGIIEAFLFALAIAIGMTPELLPVIISINLAKGAQRMAKKDVIVKELPAIEILGSMNILCTDKTGTLTQDEIRLERYESIEGKEDENVLHQGFLHSSLQTGIRNPIEKAILAHADKHPHQAKLVSQIPFDFERRRSSVIIAEHGKHQLIVKGAPESILPLCQSVLENNQTKKLDKDLNTRLEDRFRELSLQGFRVLAIANRYVDTKASYTPADENHLTFVGFMAFFDPPKESAKEALILLKNSGVSLKILTGDNELVTNKVCQELKIPISGTITGPELEKLDAAKLTAVVDQTTIFARLNPLQKELVIKTLKANGNVVGFMGDGINDASSMRAADVGISVNNAVDVAKETADIILMRKSLRVLHEGVIEGRKTYHNIMKYILMGMSSTFGNMFSMAGASIILPFLPMLPVQILLNDLLYDTSELVIPSDNVDMEAIAKPRTWNVKFIREFMLVFGPISSIFDFTTFGLLLLMRAPIPLFQTVWFIESLCSQIIIIFAIRTRRLPFFKSKPSALLITSSLIGVMLACLIPLTPLRTLFSFTTPNGITYTLIALIVLAYIALVETAKFFFYRYLDPGLEYSGRVGR